MTGRILRPGAGTTTQAFGPIEWGLLAGVSLIWGSSFLFIAEGLESFPPMMVTALRLMLGATTLALVPAARRPVSRGDELGPVPDVSVSSLAAVATLGIVGTGLAFVTMATLVGRAGATRGAVAVYFIPVVALVLGVAFRGEEVALAAVVGVGLVVVGAVMTSRQET